MEAPSPLSPRPALAVVCLLAAILLGVPPGAHASSRNLRVAKEGTDIKLYWTGGIEGRLRTRADYEVGTVVASPPTRAAWAGYLVRIKHRIRRTGPVYVYEVRQAKLPEALGSGSFERKMSVPMGSGGAATAKEKAPATCDGAVIGNFSPEFTGEMPVEFRGSWNGGDSSLTVVADPKVRLQSTAHISGAGSCKREEQLWQHQLDPEVVWVGPLPIVIVPLLSASAEGRISASGRVTASAALVVSGRFKATASRHGVSGSKHGPTLQKHAGVSTVVRGMASASGKLEFAGLLYGLTGPKVELSAGPEFKFSPNEYPWWRLKGKFVSSIGVDAWVLGIDKSLPLYQTTFPLCDALHPC